jgi:hypothetical protein
MFAAASLPPWARTVVQAAAVAVFVQAPTSAELYKYVPNHQPPLASVLAIVVTFLGALALFTSLERFEGWRRFAGSWTVTVILLAGVTAVSPVAYQLWAHHLPKGASASAVTLAMTLPVHALLHGHQMYDIALPASVPASPGPGWVILNAPFTLIHASWLLIPFWLSAVAMVTRIAYGRGMEVNVALVLLYVSPHFARMLAEDQDLLIVPCALMVLLMVASRWVRSMPAAVVLGFFAGVVATSRILYTAFPLVLGLMAWRRSRRQAVAVSAVGIGVAVVCNLVAAFGIHPYPPAHLFGRADIKEPTYNVVIGGAVTVSVAIGLIVRYLRRDDDTWLYWLAGAWAVAHGFIGFGELAGVHWVFRYWEGANYVFVGAVPLVAAVMLWRARSSPVPARPPEALAVARV